MLHWLFQRVTAIFLVLGMAVHILVLPLGGERLSYSLVSGRLSHKGWIVFDLLLLLSCIYHGLNGIWGVILDYNPKSLKTIGYTIPAIAFIFLVLGIAAIGGFR
ncbi:MAG: succinate dehydrogenase, hydrophobic membrane anchor protein [Deltaproteobacteria bacterium]|nr:succinate dehydrogenase, hydrophobic membrane anchor protein [Deltaproteobacteria bacterium]